MIAWIKACYTRPVPPTVEELAAAELDEAKREWLKAQTDLERANARVDFHLARITRLLRYLESVK